MRQREDGACYVYTKSDGSCFVLPRSEYPRLKQEWMAGRAFYEGTHFYGSPISIKLGDVVAISIKLGDVVAICDSSAETLQQGRDDRAEDEREDAIHT